MEKELLRCGADRLSDVWQLLPNSGTCKYNGIDCLFLDQDDIKNIQSLENPMIELRTFIRSHRSPNMRFTYFTKAPFGILLSYSPVEKRSQWINVENIEAFNLILKGKKDGFNKEIGE